MGDGGDNAMYLMTDCASAASCSLQQDPRIVSAVVRFRVLAQRTHKLGSSRKRGCTMVHDRPDVAPVSTRHAECS